jgi:hypothetical protein
MKVKELQELLCLNGYNVVIDGIMGPATKQALINYQKENGLTNPGELTVQTVSMMLYPFVKVAEIWPPDGRKANEMLIKYAGIHFGYSPKEIGGQNMGPWVRLYMDGNEGKSWPWCAGFVSYLLKQTYKSLGQPLPFKTSFSCQELAKNAYKNGMLKVDKELDDAIKSNLAGSIFIIHKDDEYIHTGIVISADKETFVSIEGNTNDDGSAEGYEVCKRIRNYDSKDFIILS